MQHTLTWARNPSPGTIFRSECYPQHSILLKGAQWHIWNCAYISTAAPEDVSDGHVTAAVVILKWRLSIGGYIYNPGSSKTPMMRKRTVAGWLWLSCWCFERWDTFRCLITLLLWLMLRELWAAEVSLSWSPGPTHVHTAFVDIDDGHRGDQSNNLNYV